MNALLQKKRVVSIAAIQSSQVLAQLSTVRNADGLICRVRNGSGSFPVAMAAMPIYIMFDFLFIKVQRKHREIVVATLKVCLIKSQGNPNTSTSPVSGSCIAGVPPR